MCFAPQRRALFRHFFDIWTSKSGPRPSVFNTFDLEMCFAPQRRALFQHLNFQKWSGAECVLYILTWKCASRHNGVHFFDISTSKSGPNLVCFVHFDLEMCFAATTACTFSTSQLPKVVRRWCVLCILTWKCASRHNGVQFFISHLASWLRTRRFSEPTFRASGAPNHWKNTVFRDFPTFSRICSVFPLTLSLLIFSLLIFLFSVPLPCSAFHLSILSEVWLLNFLRSGFGKPRILCVNPRDLSKPYKNFGFGYVRYRYIYISLSLSVCLSICLSICLCLYPSISLFVLVSSYLSMCPYLSVCLAIYVSSCPSNYLSVCPSIDLSIYLSVCLSVYLCIYLCVYLSIDLSMCLSIRLSIYRSICLSIDLSIYLSVSLSLSLSLSLSFICLAV